MRKKRENIEIAEKYRDRILYQRAFVCRKREFRRIFQSLWKYRFPSKNGGGRTNQGLLIVTENPCCRWKAEEQPSPGSQERSTKVRATIDLRFLPSYGCASTCTGSRFGN
jgi:hypothetical protein